MENRQPSLVERLQAFSYEPADLGRLVLYSFPSIAALDSLLGGQQILALAVVHQATIVIIDTTSRVVAGKENDADTYLAFYRHTVIPLRRRGIALLRIDHPGKDVTRGARGSSAKKGDVDTEWLLTKLSEATFGLDRQKERDNHGDSHLVLRRHAEPLRHEVTTGSGDRAAELAAELDRLNVPPEPAASSPESPPRRRDQSPRNRPGSSTAAPQRGSLPAHARRRPKRFPIHGNRREPLPAQ